MIRRSYRVSALALAVTLSVTLASADFTGDSALATEQGNTLTDDTPAGSEEIVPEFVSNEIVQPVPSGAADETTGEDEENSDRGEVRASSLRELVSETHTDRTLSDQLQCLAGAVYFEARGEPLDGQLAVAQVIINRTESGAFPDSYCNVVHQRAQFSFVKNGRMPRIRTGSAAWTKAKAIARIAHEGLWQSAADDSLYFHAKYVHPSWSRTKTARATINTHIFYR